MVLVLVTHSCPTLQSHGLYPATLLCPWILQARILEWVAIPFSKLVHVSGLYCCYSVAKSSLALCDQVPLFSIVSQSLLKFLSIESVMLSNLLILCHPLLLLPSVFPSIMVFFIESVLCIRWPEYWSFNFSSVLPVNIQDLFPLQLTSWISLQSKGLSRVSSRTTVRKHQFFGAQRSLWSSSHFHT